MPDSHPAPPHAVDRPALRRRLDVGARSPLTLLIAPAGSGKTVLLAQWVHSRPDLSVAWYHFTAADADPAHFAQRFVAGLGARHPALADLAAPLGEARGGLGVGLIDSLIVALTEYDGEIVLVFDDLHLLPGREIADDLWRLAERLPPHAHMIVSSRVDPGHRWSAHRLTHALVEIRQADLALDDAETARVLGAIAGEAVSAEAVRAIRARTEGWAAGIQLAGLSLRFRGGADPDALADAFAESDRLVVDYLSEEVLAALPDDRRRALLCLSVVDELTGPLATALCGNAGGADDDVEGSGAGEELLRSLVRESLFVAPVEGSPGSYRFHHLIRDVLRYRLRAEDPRAEGILLGRAADWFIAEGDSTTAIDLLLRARSWDRALALILGRGREVYERGHAATLARWLAAVPADVRRRSAHAEALYAVSLGMSSNAAEAEAVARSLLLDGADAGVELVLRAYIAAAVQFRPHPELYLGEARRALEMLDEQPDRVTPPLMGLGHPTLLRTLALVAGGRALFFLGRFGEARTWLRRAAASPGGQYPPYRVHTLGSLALLEAIAGNLRLAEDLADEALSLAADTDLLAHPAPADAYLGRAVVAVQRGEPEQGALVWEEGMRRAEANRRNSLAWVGYAVGRLVDLDSTVDRVAPEGVPVPLARTIMDVVRYRLAREAGEPFAAIPRQARWSSLAFEEVAALLARGHVSAARARLDDLAIDTGTAEPTAVVEYELCRAWAAAEAGRVAPAQEHLRAALAIGEREGLVHGFLRAGPAVVALVAGLPGSPGPFRRRVLERARRSETRGEGLLAEPLTSRELELLAYLPTRLTNVELAQRCYVSVNTIKTHVSHIYRKLGVQGRSAAVARAVELGLLPEAAVELHPAAR
ncbi:LuxR C-terminal-related transcriptional regulator [Microbacterium chocolatum]|uniref:LuxR C-terminal-related transcriptional regulator n=1 Tax=Microbacterium aurantiacum TaxID=162393 RepID=UPI00338F3314